MDNKISHHARSALSAAERTAIAKARSFNQLDWGSSLNALGPAACVATVRGAKFKMFGKRVVPADNESLDIALRAVESMAAAGGFLTVEEYLQALEELGPEILPRYMEWTE